MNNKINLKVEYLDIDKLKMYENNAKLHQDEDINAIKKSIELFGFDDPIGIWSDENVIVEGHGRLIAAKKLKMKKVPVIRLDHLSDEERKAYALAHNKITELSEWENEILNLELDDLSTIFDMSEFGFDLDNILQENEKTIIEDKIPDDDNIKKRCRKGDIWKLGDHRLICGDSTDENIIKQLMNNEHAELLLTDPPYGINVVSVNKKISSDKPFVSKGKVGYGEKGKNKIVDCNEYAPIIGDNTTETAKKCYELLKKYTKNQIIFGGNYFTDFLKPSRCWLVWDKENTGNFADAELAWTSFETGVKLYKFMWNGLCREGSRKVEGKKRVHPTQKPVGMLADILKDFSEENDSILDCFGGSGSTLIACEQLKRRCFICELDENYCDVIIQRWENLTGGKAELIENIQS